MPENLLSEEQIAKLKEMLDYLNATAREVRDLISNLESETKTSKEKNRGN